MKILSIGGILLGVVCVALGLFHIVGTTKGFTIAPKASFTFSDTFTSVDDVLKRHNSRSITEAQRGDPQLDNLIRKLEEQGILSFNQLDSSYYKKVDFTSSSEFYEPEMIAIGRTNYALSKYEVTQAQWHATQVQWYAIMDKPPSSFNSDNIDPSFFKGCGDCPVENVSWNDVQEFIQRLNQITGKQYRLPTEKEWRFACWGGGEQQYCGSDDVNAVGWNYYNSNNRPHPVGQKQANGYGLFDMSGNVAEWSNDCYSENCAQHLYCGGDWNSISPLAIENASCFWAGNSERSFMGFRLARTLR